LSEKKFLNETNPPPFKLNGWSLSKRGFYHSKWLLEIKNTLYECGLNVMWELLNLIILVKNVKKCLSDKFIQNWNSNVMNSAKCFIIEYTNLISVLSNIYQCYHLI
jgi:hypothetical protein